MRKSDNCYMHIKIDIPSLLQACSAFILHLRSSVNRKMKSAEGTLPAKLHHALRLDFGPTTQSLKTSIQRYDHNCNIAFIGNTVRS